MDELAMYILDIAINSIEANAKHISIKVKDCCKENRIDIEIVDDGQGIEESKLKCVVDPFYTTRTTRSVGLGISLFKESIELTGGSFEIQSTKKVGTKIHGIYVKDHIDTPRMGDLTQTIITLIQRDETIDYFIEYTQDEAIFIFDTNEVKKILKDVRINEPRIMVWLQNYIKEELSQ